MKTQSGMEEFIELRRKAEQAALELENADPSLTAWAALSPGKLKELIHELQVHQIELDMQNDELRQVQAELEASRSRYFDLYILAPVGYLILNERSKILECNLTAARLLGVTRSALVNRPFSLLIQSTHGAVYEKTLKILAETDSPQRCELCMKQKDGAPFWVLVEMSRGLDAEGGLAYHLAMTDITERKQAEATLLQSQQNIQTIFDTTKEGLALNEIVYDENGDMIDYRILSVNQAFYTTADFHGEKVIGGLASQLYNMPRAMIKTFWQEHRGKRTTAFTEMISPLSQRYYIVATSPFFDNKFVTTFMDVTEQRQAERLIRESETRLNKAQHFAHLGSWIWNIKTGQLDWSDEMFTIFGLEKSTFSGNLSEVIAQTIHPDDRAKVERANLSVIQEGKPVPVEYRIILPDGSLNVVWAEAGELTFDDSGAPLLLSGTVQDITERKRMDEARLLQSTALNAAANAMVITNNVGLIEWVNPAFSALTGYAAEEVVGQNPGSLVKSGYQDREFYRDLWDTILAGQTWHGEMVNQRKDGSLYTEEQTITPLKDEYGAIRHFIGIKQDVTDRKQAEAELRQYHEHLEEKVRLRTAELELARDQADAANRAKSDFLAMMSHEIRTPLNGVLGSAQLLEQSELTDKQRTYLANLESSGQSLLAVINDILDFSKIESGKVSLELTDFNLDEELARLSGSVSHRAWEKDLELVFETAPETPRLLVGDPARLMQVLLNLVGNAIKFTQAGSVVLRIRPLEQTPGQARLEFSVQDTGIGLTDKQIRQLFNPFTQADSSTSRKYGGTGLGLSISQRLVQIMGGQISVESQPGIGSIFAFSLALGLPPAVITGGLPSFPELAGRGVLLVDDNLQAQAALHSLLEAIGCQVSLARTAEAGLELLAQPDRHFELIFMDWNLHAGLNGLEIIRNIKTNLRKKHTSAILLVSATEMMRLTENNEIEGYIIKPLLRPQVFDTLRCVLDDRLTLTRSKPAVAGQTGPLKPFLPVKTLDKLRGGRILLVEDNEINQFVALEMLKKMGLQASLAGSGEQALAMVQEQAFDAILMDIQMPGMDGYLTTTRIRINPGVNDAAIPIIAMTANAMQGDREKALQAGMNDYVSKPIDLLELSRVLVDWVIPGKAVAGPAAARPTPGTSEPPTPASPLDMPAALARLGNNQPLYGRVLTLFQSEHTQAAAKIRAALAAQDHELARRLTHTLKGVAGTVGATDLFAAAKNLEAVIAAADPAAIEPALAQVEANLSAVLDAIARMDSPRPDK